MKWLPEILLQSCLSYGWDELARNLGLGPTVFAYDISRMIAGVLFMGAAGYGLMRGVHIRADFIYRNWSDKTQATVDALAYIWRSSFHR